MLGSLYIFSAISLYYLERKKAFAERMLRYSVPGYSSEKKAPQMTKEGESLFEKLEDWLVRNDVKITGRDLILIIAAAVSAVLMISAFFKNGLLIFAAFSASVPAAVFAAVDFKGRRAMRSKEDMLEGFILDLIANLYSHENILAAFRKTIIQMENPLRAEIETVVEDTRKGLLINEALSNLIKRNRSSILKIIFTGMIAANDKGADIQDFLKSQLGYLREKKSITNYIRILSAGPRYTSYIIAVIPLIVVAAGAFLNRDFILLLTRGAGLAVLFYSIASYTAGFAIINRIINSSISEDIQV